MRMVPHQFAKMQGELVNSECILSAVVSLKEPWSPLSAKLIYHSWLEWPVNIGFLNIRIWDIHCFIFEYLNIFEYGKHPEKLFAERQNLWETGQDITQPMSLSISSCFGL